MDVSKTSLSVGGLIKRLLTEDPAVSGMVTKVYAVETLSARMPYVTYRRVRMEVTPQKRGQPGADTVLMEVACYAGDYDESVKLAEAVRGALDYVEAEHEGQRLRACHLSDSDEDKEGDAYIQRLIFTIKA